MSDESKAVQPVCDATCPACERGEQTITPPHSSVVGSMSVHTPSGQICTKSNNESDASRWWAKNWKKYFPNGLFDPDNHLIRAFTDYAAHSRQQDAQRIAELEKHGRWMQESLGSFRAKFQAKSNCEALDAIDELKQTSERAEAEVARLKADMRSMAAMLESGEWSNLLSSDEDLAALDAAISQLISKYTNLRGDTSAKLRQAAEEIVQRCMARTQSQFYLELVYGVEAILKRHLEGK